MMGKMSSCLALITVNVCLVASALALDEGNGFGLSVAGNWLGETKEVTAAVPFLRGSNYTDMDIDETFIDFEFDEEFYSDLEEALDIGAEWDSTATAFEDELGERQLVQMSNRDKQWLTSHNKRRMKYHSKYNKKYIPLKWSPKLKRSSKKWAKHLANLCGRQGIYHDPVNQYGENLAANWGTGSWATRPSTESVLTRLVENEEKFGYPKNGHFTQVSCTVLCRI
jgi:hypothetical protein